MVTYYGPCRAGEEKEGSAWNRQKQKIEEQHSDAKSEEEAISHNTTDSQQLSQVELPASQVESDENDGQIVEPESLQEENTEDKPA